MEWQRAGPTIEKWKEQIVGAATVLFTIRKERKSRARETRKGDRRVLSDRRLDYALCRRCSISRAVFVTSPSGRSGPTYLRIIIIIERSRKWNRMVPLDFLIYSKGQYRCIRLLDNRAFTFYAYS